MKSIPQGSLEFNNNLSFDFGGGNLTSDSGLLIVRDLLEKLGLRKVLQSHFDDDTSRKHTISSIIEQLIYQHIAGYHQDDAADELRHDPVFTNILEKEVLASQPTISRVLNHFTKEDATLFNGVLQTLYLLTHPAETTKQIVLDLDSTNVQTHGHQELSEYIVHYASKGYHPLVLFDGLTGDLMKMVLRKGSVYTSKGIRDFLEPVVKALRENYPEATILVRGDSGFAMPELYELCDEYGLHYVIRLKANNVVHQLTKDTVSEFLALYGQDYSKSHALHDEFDYQAGSWSHPRRVVCKVERDAGNLEVRTSFIITSLEAAPETVVHAYHKRGNMENFIKEYKLDFGAQNLSHSSFAANQAKAMVLAIAYNIINAMKRLVLPKSHTTSRMLSLRSTFIKIGGRAICHARKCTIRLASSYPFKQLFYGIFERIRQLSFA